jgi:hypothetical protein
MRRRLEEVAVQTLIRILEGIGKHFAWTAWWFGIADPRLLPLLPGRSTSEEHRGHVVAKHHDPEPTTIGATCPRS